MKIESIRNNNKAKNAILKIANISNISNIKQTLGKNLTSKQVENIHAILLKMDDSFINLSDVEIKTISKTLETISFRYSEKFGSDILNRIVNFNYGDDSKLIVEKFIGKVSDLTELTETASRKLASYLVFSKVINDLFKTTVETKNCESATTTTKEENSKNCESAAVDNEKIINTIMSKLDNDPNLIKKVADLIIDESGLTDEEKIHAHNIVKSKFDEVLKTLKPAATCTSQKPTNTKTTTNKKPKLENESDTTSLIEQRFKAVSKRMVEANNKMLAIFV